LQVHGGGGLNKEGGGRGLLQNLTSKERGLLERGRIIELL